MAQEKSVADKQFTATKKAKINGEPQPGRAISDPQEVAQLVMLRIDQVNSKKDELTIAMKSLSDITRQLANVYAKQQVQITQLSQQVAELEKSKK